MPVSAPEQTVLPQDVVAPRSEGPVQPGRDHIAVSGQLPKNLAKVFGVEPEELTPVEVQKPLIDIDPSMKIPLTGRTVGDAGSFITDTVTETLRPSEVISPRITESKKGLEEYKERIMGQEDFKIKKPDSGGNIFGRAIRRGMRFFIGPKKDLSNMEVVERTK